MASYHDLLDAIARVRSVTGDPDAWKKGLTGADVATAFNPASPPAALGAVLTKLAAAHPDVFLGDSPAGPAGPPPRIGEGAAADAIRDAEAALARQNTDAAHVDLQVVTAVLNAHAARDDGLAELTALQRDIEEAVRTRTDLDTPAGAREFQRYLIGNLREIRHVVEESSLDATSKASLAAALAALYASTTPDPQDRTTVAPAGREPEPAGHPPSREPDGSAAARRPLPWSESLSAPGDSALTPESWYPGPEHLWASGALDPLPDGWPESSLPAAPPLPAPASPSPAPVPVAAPPPMSLPPMTPPSWGGLPAAAPLGAGLPGVAPGLGSTSALSPLADPARLNLHNRADRGAADIAPEAPTEPDTPPEHAGDDPAASASPADAATAVDLPDGNTVTAPSPELAAAITAAIGGTPIPDAFRQQGITLPVPGAVPVAPLDPGALAPGDIGMLTDRHALALGNGKALLDTQIKPISSVMGPGFLGWQHPPQPEPSTDTPDVPAPNRAAATAPS